MPNLRIIFLFINLGLTFNCFGQLMLNEVDLNKIEQKKIREYITNQKEHQIEKLADIKPSLQLDASVTGYRTRENIYEIKEQLRKVWQIYVNTNPGESWKGKILSFGVLLSKKDKKIVYRGENVSKIDTGQVVYLNLKLIKGLKNMATAFEVINIDNEKQIIEFSYLTGNLSEGKQRLTFYETPKGYTRIVHTSYYKSNTILKNYFLYPFFHTRITNDFHRNMKKIILKN